MIYTPAETSAQLFYATELGLFTRAGLDAQMQPNAFAGDVVSAVVAASADIGFGTIPTLAIARSKGIPLVFVAPAALFIERKTPTAGIVVASTSAIKTAKDLNGKIFGTAGLASMSEYGPRAWIDANGGDSSTVKFVEFPFPQLGAAVAAGRVDAAYIINPFFTQALKDGRSIGEPLSAVAPEFLTTGWFASPDWARAHPTVVAPFAQAMRAAAIWARLNPAKAVDVLVKYLKVDPVATAATPRIVYGEELTAATMQPAIDVTARYAKIKTFPASEIIYAL